jgi:hypothetical protein
MQLDTADIDIDAAAYQVELKRYTYLYCVTFEMCMHS